MKKNTIFCAALLALVIPYIVSILTYMHQPSALVAESSVYSLNRHLYFSGLLHNGSLFFAGHHSVFLATYFVFYALWSDLATVVPGAASYFTLLIAFTALGLLYFVRLFLTLCEQPEAMSTRHSMVACMFGVLYFSSVSIFNYLKSNALFALPYLLLPSFLYLALSYVMNGDKRRLILLLLLSLLLTDLNLAHTLILIVFLNVFLIATRRLVALPAKRFALRLALVNLVLAPACCFLVVLVLENAWYSGSLSTFAKNIAENMYSENAFYLNIFLQLTDWGIFGSWLGSLYYIFSPYYSRHKIQIFGLFPYLLLAACAITTRARGNQRRLAGSLLLIIVVLFQIMLGNNNILYRLLYEHMSAFQVFRNVTKLAPLLYFTVLLATYILIQGRLNQTRYFLAILLGILASLTYNIPYWSYGGRLFADRVVTIPTYWKAASTYLLKHVPPYSNILTLPAIYINDVFEWDGRPAWVQGSLLDIFAPNQSYRLSECCIGSPLFERDAKAVFQPSDRSLRRVDANYPRLTKLAKKYHLEYVVVSADLRSEYEDLSDIYRWLKRAGYSLSATFGPVSIYRNTAYAAMPFSGARLMFQEINPLRYRIFIPHLQGTQTITFAEPYNSGWAAFADVKPSEAWCEPRARDIGMVVQCSAGAERPWDEIAMLRRTSAVASFHGISGAGGNKWILNTEYIKRNVPRNAYRVNADGSIEMEFELLFRPQGYLFLACYTGALVFLAILVILIHRSLGERVDRTFGALAAAIAILIFTIGVIAKEASEPSEVVHNDLSTVRDSLTRTSIVPSVGALTFYNHRQLRTRRLSFSLRGGRNHGSVRWNIAGCSNVVDYTWSPRSASGESIGAVIAPVAVGNCLLQVSATVRGGAKAWEALPITVMGPLSWSTKRYEEQVFKVLPSTKVSAATFALSKMNDVRGVSPTLAENSCGRVARVYPENGPPLQDGSNMSEAAVIVRPRAPGVCAVTLRDQYAGLQAVPVRLHLRVMSALSMAPNRKQSSVVIRFRNTASPGRTIVLYKKFDSELIEPRFGTNRCDRVAGFYVGHKTAPRKPALKPATTVIVVVPTRAGQCESTFVDQYGSSDTTVAVRVIVGS